MSTTEDSSLIADEQSVEDAQDALAIAATPEPLSVGQQLRAAREAKGMSLADVARALKLSTRQIEALETEDWSSLPGMTIIRGFIRNEARLLGLNSDLLMAELDKLNMPQVVDLELKPGTPVSISGESAADRRDYVRVISGLIILGLAIAAFFLLPQDWWQSSMSALKAVSQSNEAVVESEPVASPEEEVGTAELAVVAQPDQSVVPETPSEPLPPAAVDPVAVSGNALKFSFTKPAWVEVRDRDGQIIFSRLNQADTQQIVEGQPPFSLIVGNATYVTLEYKGKAVELGNRSKDDVSRLSLE